MTHSPTPPVLDLTPIRARLVKGQRRRHDMERLLAEVDRLRALESYWQINHHAIRNDWTAAEKRAESAGARLAAIRALPEQWRKENGDYPESKLDCAADLDAAINQK